MNISKLNFAQLKQMADQLGCFSWKFDHTEEKARFSYTEGLIKFLGYSQNEINELQEGIYSLIHKDDISQVKDKVESFSGTQDESELQHIYRIVTKDDNIVWLLENVSVDRDPSGKIQTSKSLAFDITATKSETQDCDETIKNLTEMNSIKDKFISIVSHDLRAPFTTLLGFTEILLNEQDLPQEERDEYLSYIYDASKSQLQMINYLVDWSRLQTGRTKIEPCRLNAKDIISNCVSTLTGAAIRKDLEITTTIPMDLYINADDRLITQAITNLISNAIKFSESGKSIQIAANKFKEGRIEIVVKDEGIGIAEENQPKLFKIDFKYSIPGTKGEKGTGLGLALVKEIIEKHEGDIWFYSKLNEGSEFHFTIPEAKNIILIVDDNETKRKELRKSIEHSLGEFVVVEADNGYKAFNIAQEKIPSLIVINHDMPLMDGIQFIETIKAKNTLKYIPIIVKTGQLDDESLKKYSSLKVEQLISDIEDTNQLLIRIKENII